MKPSSQILEVEGTLSPLLCCKELLVAIRADQQSPGRESSCAAERRGRRGDLL